MNPDFEVVFQQEDLNDVIFGCVSEAPPFGKLVQLIIMFKIQDISSIFSLGSNKRGVRKNSDKELYSQKRQSGYVFSLLFTEPTIASGTRLRKIF
ncbi:MAG: hypothetical protein C6Y22_18930 [Hapalosiphonaceae cyanobacterium JJU2]|nr:MAG: hypothetical protein C6Y22_18930 [Hapalosiphonaceae cyanobacterium JJU2]